MLVYIVVIIYNIVCVCACVRVRVHVIFKPTMISVIIMESRLKFEKCTYSTLH